MTREEINLEKQKKITRENNYERNKKIVLFTIKLFFIVSIILALFVAYTTYISTVQISVREYRIVDEKLPSHFDGIKILHLSDLHFGSTMFEENMKQIKKLVNERKPDLIVYTGDLIDKSYKLTNKRQEYLSKELGSLNANLGKYAVLGDEDDENIMTIYNQSDFQVLNNDYDLIYETENKPFMLVGLSSYLNGSQDLDKAYQYFKQDTYDSNIFVITLVHEPDSIKDILEMYPNTDMVFAGHSLNGSIRTPFSHIPFERKKGAKYYSQDFYQIQDTKLYVSGGLGTSNLPIRLFCRPSINFYRISS